MTYRYHHVLTVMLLVAITGFAAEYSTGIKTYDTFANLTHVMRATLNDVDGHGIAKEETGLGLLPWFIAGSLLGGYVCVAFRKIALGSEAARYFTVSVIVGLIVSPLLSFDGGIFRTKVTWYQALAVSGACSSGAWGGLELLTLTFTSLYKAGQERGVAGIRDQLLLILSLGLIARQPPQESNSMVATSTIPKPVLPKPSDSQNGTKP